jgi:hypothetical protein
VPSLTAVVPVLLLSADLAFAQSPNRLVAASNVRIRAAPREGAAEVRAVPLGTPLVELETGGESGAWVRARLPDGADGWVPARLTRKIGSETPASAVEGLVKERLVRKGDSFPARAELVDLVERTRPTLRDPEQSGRFALYWLQAMTNILSGIPMGQDRQAPYAAWLTARRAAVVFNEPARRWILRRDAILDVHARERDTSAADDIAWFAVTTGLPGECEYFVPCYLRRANDLTGEYLRLHATGRHAADAVSRLADAASLWATPPAAVLIFDPARDCGELMGSLAPLRAAVLTTLTERRGAALDALDKLGSRCAARPF